MHFNKYLKICEWARKRYQESPLVIVTYSKGQPTKYTRICQSAFNKYIFSGEK